MKLSDIFFAILYGAAFILIIYFIFSLFHKSSPSTVVIYQDDETPVYQESVWWPWAGGSYNYWPSWTGWYNGGGDGGYYGRGYGGGRRHWGGGRPWGGSGRGGFGGGGRGGFGGGGRGGFGGGGRGGFGGGGRGGGRGGGGGGRR
jgi:hypothetical protein